MIRLNPLLLFAPNISGIEQFYRPRNPETQDDEALVSDQMTATALAPIPTPIATETPTATQTPTPLPTATFTPTATPPPFTVGTLRALQNPGDPRVYIERALSAGIDTFDSAPTDGWTLIGRTNGAGENGTLRAFTVIEGVPY